MKNLGHRIGLEVDQFAKQRTLFSRRMHASRGLPSALLSAGLTIPSESRSVLPVVSLGKHDEVLLEALTRDVRLLSVSQATRLMGCDSVMTDSVIGKLTRSGFVAAERRLISVHDEASDPIYSWSPGDPEPAFRQAGYQLRSRWESTHESVVLYPTDKACELFGGTRVMPRSAGEADHDLWMSEVYLCYRLSSTIPLDLSWESGDSLRNRGATSEFDGVVPDACLARSDGTIERIIEGGGKGYGAAKLSRLHDCYSVHGEYELW